MKMKATGPTKVSTRKLIVALEKTGKKAKQRFWMELAETIGKPRRQAKSINLWKLSKLAKQFPNSMLVVPGKVLAAGEVEGKLSIAAFGFSAGAKEKIAAAKGKALTLEELVQAKPKASDCVIIG